MSHAVPRTKAPARFLLYGHNLEDLLRKFSSAYSPMILVGKALTVRIPSEHERHWLHRDGPNHMWFNELWGSFTVGTPNAPTQ